MKAIKMKRSIEFRKMAVLLSAVLAALFLLFPAVRAGAEPVRVDLIPLLRLQEEWKSNALNTSNNRVSSFATRIRPGLGVRMTSVDNVSVTFTGNYEKVWHYDSDARKADRDTWNIRVDSDGKWAFSPNFSVTPSVYFINTEESGRRAAFVPMHDPILSPASAIAYSSTKRQSFGSALDFVYRISPVWDANLRLNYSNERFTNKNAAAGGSDPIDSSQANVRAGFSYAISPISKAGLFAQASFVSFKNLSDSEIYSLGATYNYQFTHFLQIFLDAGVSHIVKDNNSGSGSGSSSKTGPTGSIRLQYNNNAFTAALFGNAIYSGGSGYGDIIREYQTGIRLSQKFTETFTGLISGYYQHGESIRGNAVDIDTLGASATLTYQPWEIASFFLQGAAENQKSHSSFGYSIENYLVVLGVSVSNVYKIY